MLACNCNQQGVLEILTSASEFDTLPMRHGEERALRQLAAHVPLSNDSLKFTDPHTKAFLLLQAHLSRMPVAGDLAMDQKTVLKEVLKLVQAMVDVLSSSGWLKPALAAMEVSQMCVQVSCPLLLDLSYSLSLSFCVRAHLLPQFDPELHVRVNSLWVYALTFGVSECRPCGTRRRICCSCRGCPQTLPRRLRRPRSKRSLT